MDIHNLLVPTDFTTVADSAISHAIKIAEKSNAKVYVLHVVSDKDKAEEARSKVNKQISKFLTSANISAVVRIGSFFEEIGNAAEEINVEFVIMGTHGPQGLRQALTGSDAMKVVTNSKKPYIIIQERDVKETGIDTIVSPLDDTDITKQKLDEVAVIAKVFNSTVHLFAKIEEDEYMANRTRGSIAFAKKYLAENNIKTVVETITKGKTQKELLAYAKKVNADLIGIVNHQGSNIFGGLISRLEDSIITNDAKIPVLCVNPKDVGGAYSM